MTEFEQRKKKLIEALNKPVKIASDMEKAEKELEKHIGFEKQKETFKNNLGIYMATEGKFWPNREVVCYSSAPGMGKTTFVKNLATAMGRDCQIIPLAGFTESKEFSILGDGKKPSLVAWAIEKSSSKNPVILLDELEKVEDKNILSHLVQLFKDYKKGKKFTDKYFKAEIDLGHITFFATVNYLDNLDPDFKNNEAVNIIELPDFTEEEKEKILKMKAEEINKKYPEKKGGIISEQIIKAILHRIKEVGIRQAERVLYKIEQEYVYTKNKGEEFSVVENPQKWVKENVFPYQEEFKATWKHYLLFFLLGLNFVLLASWIFKRFIIKDEIES
ncbi:MAG: AAA family ATPase [Candidatus Moeniiplasma glomeromycotorum]|nr:AAA family ATPase [Candidatus Moeniiplasma glomeromycotorum]MCE8167972.1 AAA family ATPase [Candidatus Moeniiplasma glomeromycotorum]MCE8169193.1 AAA family ATPase [Candidatus Moeniiplasma glomeromycotorum]